MASPTIGDRVRLTGAAYIGEFATVRPASDFGAAGPGFCAVTDTGRVMRMRREGEGWEFISEEPSK